MMTMVLSSSSHSKIKIKKKKTMMVMLSSSSSQTIVLFGIKKDKEEENDDDGAIAIFFAAKVRHKIFNKEEIGGSLPSSSLALRVHIPKLLLPCVSTFLSSPQCFELLKLS
jgi:hypothetical protein